MSTVVVYVHGLWLNGWESAWLTARLERGLGATARRFSYRSVTGKLADHGAALASYLSTLRADTVHLVGHSMGGIVILDCFERVLGDGGRAAHAAAVPPGRIVLLGSPVRGSEAAKRLARFRFGLTMLGLTAREALLEEPAPRWSGSRELGVIAGTLALGLGRMVGRLPAASDGTVMVRETDLPGATDRLTLPVSHSGFLFSKAVAAQTIAFLRTGAFSR